MVLAGRLRAFLARRYPRLPAKALDEAVAAARNPDGVTVDQRNMNFHQMLTRGYELKFEADGQDRYEHITLIDGDRLTDLLIEHGIGVRRETVEVLSLDEEGLYGDKQVDAML